MSSVSSTSVPAWNGVNANWFFPDSPKGRFGRAAAGYGPTALSPMKMGAGQLVNWGSSPALRALQTYHNRGMLEVWQGFGLGSHSVFDLATYGVGGGETLGSVAAMQTGIHAAPAFTPGFRGALDELGHLGGTARKLFTSMESNWARAGLAVRFGVAGAFRTIPLAFTVGAAYTGWKEGGVLGAGVGVAKSTAFNYASGLAFQALGTFGIPAILAGGAALGSYAALSGGASAIRRRRRMEMAAPLSDPFGTGATMRQRSLNLLQNSQLNGRSAMGSEAYLMHTPVMRY